MRPVRLLHRLSPWEPVESVRLAAVAAAGGLVLLVAWIGAANEARFGGQIGWLNLATAGFVIAAYGATTWVLRARASLRRRRDALLLPLVDADGPGPAVDAVDAAATVVAGPDVGRFHRPGCALAAGRGWPIADRARLEAAGRRPCGVCRP